MPSFQASGDYYAGDFESYLFWLLIEVDCLSLTEFFTDFTYALLEEEAAVFVYHSNTWYCLRKNHEDCFPFSNAHIEFARNSDWTLFCTFTATGTFFDINEPRFLQDSCHEIACGTRNLFDLRIRKQLYVRMRKTFDHLGRKYTYGAVHRRERFVKLGHSSADAWRLFDEIHVDSAIGNIQSGLYSRYASTNHKNRIILHANSLVVP